MSARPPRRAGADGSCLWLSVSKPRLAWTTSCAVLIAYLISMQRDLGFYDSPLLSLAAVQLGLAHPPGQPLHTLLGAALIRVSPFAPLATLSGLSALAGALTVIPALSLAERMLSREARSESVLRMVALVLALGSMHAALWEQATRVEVYALSAFLALWCTARLTTLLDAPSASLPAFLGLGVVLGLCACANPVIAVFALLASIPEGLLALLRKQLSLSAVAAVGAGGLIGLFPYGYIPWVAEHSDGLVWGSPHGSDALLSYLTARDFATNLSVPLARFAAQIASWLAWSYDFALLPLLALGSVAFLALPSRGSSRATGPIAVLLAIGYICHYAIFKPEVPDYVSYISVATWLSLAGVSALAGHLVARGLRSAAWAVAATLLGTTLLAPPGLLSRSRSQDRTARTLALALVEQAPPHSVLLLSSDHWVAPLLYLQEAEALRPDLVLLASGLASSRWHWDRVYARHPDLAPFALQGPGGRIGRIARFLKAQAARRVIIEDGALAAQLGHKTCLGRVLLELGDSCDPRHADAFGRTLAQLSAALDIGEPTALGVLAQVSLVRGSELWARGQPALALPTLLSGVPASWGATYAPPAALGQVPALRKPLPQWQQQVPIGDPARNLFVAARLAHAASDTQQAQAWAELAREHGLTEAAMGSWR